MKFAPLMIALVVLLPPAARLPRQTTSPFTVAGSSFALSVADIVATERWYVDKLGLTVVRRIPSANGNAVTILSGAGLIVELVQRDGAQSLSKAVPTAKDNLDVHGIFKVGIVVDDFDRLSRRFDREARRSRWGRGRSAPTKRPT